MATVHSKAINEWFTGIRGILNETKVPGLVISVIFDGREAVATGIGYAHPDRQVPLTGDEQFYVYSVTKTLLALAVLQLVESEQVALDDPVIGYLPDLSDTLPDVSITVRQLLNHTSGLPDYGSLPEYTEAVRASPGDPWTEDTFLARTLEQGLAFAPGEGWAYSNIGFLILKRLVERVNRATLQEVLHAAVFEPLDLTRTFVAESLADSASLAPGYSTFFTQSERLEDISQIYHPGWVSHGVVISTASELARIVEAIVGNGGPLLKAESRRAMVESIKVPLEHPYFRHPSYGLGVMIDAASPFGQTVGHGGGGPGYSHAALHFANVEGHRVTIAASANSDRSDIGMRLAFSVVEKIARGLSQTS